MQATVNENKPSEGGARKLYTGVANAFVLALNPTKAELEAMGYKPKDEPDYFIKDKDKNDEIVGIRLTFHLEFSHKEDTRRVQLSLPLRKELMESEKNPENKTTNRIDKFGKSMFLSDADLANAELENKYHWLDFKSMKKAVKGQIELIDFLKCYSGAKNDEVMALDPSDLREIFSGDVSSIKKGVLDKSMAQENAVRVLLGVREYNGKQFQTVFNRKFDYPWSYTSKYIHKAYIDNKSYTDGDFGITSDDFNERDMDLKEYDPQPVGDAPQSNVGAMAGVGLDVMGGGSENAFGASAPANTTAPVDDDLPF